MLQRTVFGPVRHEWDGLEDQKYWWEHSAVVGLVALIVLLGVYPALIMDMVGPAVEPIVARIGL